MAGKNMSDNSSAPPCAGCKIQRKKCSEKCVLAPYFPQNDTQKFMLVHKVFGNGHVIKLLQELPVEKRGDAVSSMVYEASQRLKDPVHGCVGVINDLMNKVAELQFQLASTQAELNNISVQHANLYTLVTGYHETSDAHFYSVSPQESEDTDAEPIVLDDQDHGLQFWDSLWR